MLAVCVCTSRWWLGFMSLWRMFILGQIKTVSNHWVAKAGVRLRHAVVQMTIMSWAQLHNWVQLWILRQRWPYSGPFFVLLSLSRCLEVKQKVTIAWNHALVLDTSWTVATQPLQCRRTCLRGSKCCKYYGTSTQTLTPLAVHYLLLGVSVSVTALAMNWILCGVQYLTSNFSRDVDSVW